MRNYKQINFHKTKLFDGCTLERFIQEINVELFGHYYNYEYDFLISKLDGTAIPFLEQIKTDTVIYKCKKIFYKPNFLLFECILPDFDNHPVAFLIHEDGTQITSMEVVKVEPNYIKSLEEDLKNV